MDPYQRIKEGYYKFWNIWNYFIHFTYQNFSDEQICKLVIFYKTKYERLNNHEVEKICLS